MDKTVYFVLFDLLYPPHCLIITAITNSFVITPKCVCGNIPRSGPLPPSLLPACYCNTRSTRVLRTRVRTRVRTYTVYSRVPVYSYTLPIDYQVVIGIYMKYTGSMLLEYVCDSWVFFRFFCSPLARHGGAQDTYTHGYLQVGTGPVKHGIKQGFDCHELDAG